MPSSGFGSSLSACFGCLRDERLIDSLVLSTSASSASDGSLESPPSSGSSCSSAGASNSSASTNFAAINCWLAPAAIKSAAAVMTRGDVRLLLNLLVTATIPVINAFAICSSSVALTVFSSSTNSKSISLTPLALRSCQSIAPKLLLMSRAVTVTTSALCKILP